MRWRERRTERTPGEGGPADPPAPGADGDPGAGFGPEHSWWAERERVRGVPLDMARLRRRAQLDFEAARARAEARRREYWSAERLLAMSAQAEAGREAWDDPEADPYAMLGLFPGATLADAAAARRRLAKCWHPDRVAGDVIDLAAAEQRMAAVNRAYDELRVMLGA